MEAYNLPVGLRKWFLERLIKQLKTEKDAIEEGKNSGSQSSQTLTPYNGPRKPKL